MALNKQMVDGKQLVEAQENALNFMEQATFAKVISYSKSMDPMPAGTFANEAILQDIPIGQQPGPLHLEIVDLGEDATEIIAQQLKAGKTIIFHDAAFVSGKDKTVLGFR